MEWPIQFCWTIRRAKGSCFCSFLNILRGMTAFYLDFDFLWVHFWHDRSICSLCSVSSFFLNMVFAICGNSKSNCLRSMKFREKRLPRRRRSMAIRLRNRVTSILSRITKWMSRSFRTRQENSMIKYIRVRVGKTDTLPTCITIMIQQRRRRRVAFFLRRGRTSDIDTSIGIERIYVHTWFLPRRLSRMLGRFASTASVSTIRPYPRDEISVCRCDKKR